MTQAQGKIARHCQIAQIPAAALFLCALLLAALSVVPAAPLLDGGRSASLRASSPALDHTLRSENLSLVGRVSADENTGAPSSAPPHAVFAASGPALAVWLDLEMSAYAASALPPHTVRSAHLPRAPPSSLLT